MAGHPRRGPCRCPARRPARSRQHKPATSRRCLLAAALSGMDRAPADARWADSAYRSRKNEALPRDQMLVSRVHRKKPTDRPMSSRTSHANAKNSAVRSHIEHVFAEQKARPPPPPGGGSCGNRMIRLLTDHGLVRPHDRPGPSDHQDRARESGPQPASPDLAGTPSRGRLNSSGSANLTHQKSPPITRADVLCQLSHPRGSLTTSAQSRKWRSPLSSIVGKLFGR